MENRLFGRRTAEERKLREKVTAQSLIACEQERAKLKQCFRTGWFGLCGQEQKEFWQCFSKVSGPTVHPDSIRGLESKVPYAGGLPWVVNSLKISTPILSSPSIWSLISPLALMICAL